MRGMLGVRWGLLARSARPGLLGMTATDGKGMLSPITIAKSKKATEQFS